MHHRKLKFFYLLNKSSGFNDFIKKK